MKTAILTIRSESASEVHEIVAFSMLEPSTAHCAFVTSEGRWLQSFGCVLEPKGDIDSLPPAPSPAEMAERKQWLAERATDAEDIQDRNPMRHP